MKKVAFIISIFGLGLEFMSSGFSGEIPRELRLGDQQFNLGNYGEAALHYQRVFAELPDEAPHSLWLAEIVNNQANLCLAQGEDYARFQEIKKQAEERKRLLRATEWFLNLDSGGALLVNGGFEQGLTYPWGTGVYERDDGDKRFGIWWNSNFPLACMKVDTAERFAGDCSLRIENSTPVKPEYFTTTAQRIAGVLPNAVYRINCQIKARELGSGAASITVDPGWQKNLPLPAGTYEWQPFEGTVNVGHSSYVDFRIVMAGTGVFWIDDIRFELASLSAQANPLLVAESLIDKGDYFTAELNLSELENKYPENSRAKAELRCLLGRAQMEQGDFDRALINFEWAKANGAWKTPQHLAELFFRMGENQRARETIFAFFAEHPGILQDQKRVADLKQSLSQIFFAQGDFPNAVAAQNEAYLILRHIEDQQGQALALYQLGILHRHYNRPEDALSFLEQSIKLAADIKDRRLLGIARCEVADFRQAFDPGQSRRELARGLTTLASIKDQAALARAFYLQAKHTKNVPVAIFFGKMAVNQLQEIRSRLRKVDSRLHDSFANTKGPIYENLAALLIQSGRIPEAQHVIKMHKQEELSEFLSQQDASVSSSSKIHFTQAEKAVSREFQALQSTWSQVSEEEASTQFLAFAERIGTQLISTADTTEAGLSTSTQGLQEALRKTAGSAVILYLTLDDEIRMILTTADSQSVFRSQVPRSELNTVLFRFRQSLGKRDQRDGNEMADAQKLYGWMIKPLVTELSRHGISKLAVSLDGAMRYVPLTALHDGEAYLAQRYAVSCFADPVEFPESHRGWKVAGFGVTKAHEGMNALPNVSQEINAIVKEGFFDRAGVLPGKVFLDRKFTPGALLEAAKQDYGVIHIASHFVFRPGTERSSFLLAGDGSRISLADLRRDYKFPGVRLLTLSACETAVGTGNGREVEGFGALVRELGAESVIATLWPVDDEGTAEFMKRLYQRLPNPAISKAEALQGIQKMFIEASQHPELPDHLSDPYFWAPFLLMGDAG